MADLVIRPLSLDTWDAYAALIEKPVPGVSARCADLLIPEVCAGSLCPP